MVQAYIALGEGELAAFRKYAEVYPNECVLLVDTIDTLGSGLPNAITVFEELRRQGHTPLGIRLDSGDLAYLSIQSANMLNEAGFPDTMIVLSNRLDELVIWQIMRQIEDEAPRSGVDPQKLIKRLSFGVGTGLITSTGDSALDGVYKLVAVENNGVWAPAFKISESAEKTLNPGHKNVWRLYDQRGKAIADVLGCGDEDISRDERITLHHPTDHSKHRTLRSNELSAIETLHVEMMKDGVVTGDLPSIEQMRESLRQDLDRLDEGVKRLMNPHIYHVSLTDRLWNLKNEFVDSTRADISRETNKTIE
jgi:nicotinate phosphoribosyltransferase